VGGGGGDALQFKLNVFIAELPLRQQDHLCRTLIIYVLPLDEGLTPAGFFDPGGSVGVKVSRGIFKPAFDFSFSVFTGVWDGNASVSVIELLRYL
jgi:hypothetical protein